MLLSGFESSLGPFLCGVYMWENTELDQGSFSYMAVNSLAPDSQLTNDGINKTLQRQGLCSVTQSVWKTALLLL